MKKAAQRSIMMWVLGSTLLFATPAPAVNWIMLQGTESSPGEGKPKFSGFVQLEYHRTQGSDLAAGPWQGTPMVTNQIGPDLESNATFQIKHARLCLRGRVPGSDTFNYLVGIGAGNNAATKYGDGIQLTDASITAKLKPWLRLRAGQFKYPGSEEGMTPFPASHYVDQSNMANQLLNETFFEGDGSGSSENTPVAKGCFHDMGLQVFGILPFGTDWEHTYAAMVGNGSGMTRSDNNDDLDIYLYWASERVWAGKGKNREGLKLFFWLQDGKRTLTAEGAGTYDRNRTGAGFTFRRSIWRLAGEYTAADGMIPNGTDGCAVPGTLNNAGTQIASFNLLPEEKADGWYVDAGLRIMPPLWINVRYDRLNRATENPGNERRYDTATVGLDYAFNPKIRLAANYAWRWAEAPNLPDASPVNQNLDRRDDKISAMFQVVFP